MATDNVIPFPSPQDRGESPRAKAQRIAEELLSQGHDPRDLVSSLLSQAASMNPAWTPPSLHQPAPRPPRKKISTYRIRVDLDHTKPPIWRRLELASDLRLDELHGVLQTAMGWTDSHLHHFVMGPQRDRRTAPFLTDFDLEEGDTGVPERNIRLDQVLSEVGDRLFYEYDFGDGWQHTLRLEGITPYDAATARAHCTGGRRACPPEDCGGPGGYADLLTALADPASADEWQRELLAWMRRDFDPTDFSATDVDAQLARDHGSDTPT